MAHEVYHYDDAMILLKQEFAAIEAHFHNETWDIHFVVGVLKLLQRCLEGECDREMRLQALKGFLNSGQYDAVINPRLTRLGLEHRMVVLQEHLNSTIRKKNDWEKKCREQIAVLENHIFTLQDPRPC